MSHKDKDMSGSSSSDEKSRDASLFAVRATIVVTGGSEEFASEITDILRKVFLTSGIRGFSLIIKGWSKAIRSLMSLESFDTSNVGYCKNSCNSRHALRRAGCTEEECDIIAERYSGICGIPPILLNSHYVKVLLPDCQLSEYRKALPFANIGRCAPTADAETCRRSIQDFLEVTGSLWDWNFDFSVIAAQYAELCCTESAPVYSRWEASSKSSFDYSREAGGKLGEVIDLVVNDFMYKTIDEIVPYRPLDDLYDIFGNVALKCDDWRQGAPITEVLYSDLSSGEFMDGRFGLFGVLWAMSDLIDRYPGEFIVDTEFGILGYEPPSPQFQGTVECRICSVEEMGWKARVITITPLSVGLVQVVLRHCLDPFIRSDPNVKIGLLSKVKLYDLMVRLNGGDRNGVTNNSGSFYFKTVESVDLTTATDSPFRKSIHGLLESFVRIVLPLRMKNFYDMVLDIALSEREFVGIDIPDHWCHNCGIMMGEAMSGVYLNVMSGIVRASISNFRLSFLDFRGTSVDNCDEFIRINQNRIQEWLDTYVLATFNLSSSQSGDDVVIFNELPQGECQRFLKLLYRVFGLRPSESTFYSSEHMGTFTEEFCIKNASTNGWTFVDIIKPRLFLPGELRDDLESVVSRIRQITGMLKYQSNDLDFVHRVASIVDEMILMNPVIKDRCKKYGIVENLPSFLGGLDHPAQYDNSWFLDYAPEDLDYIVRLSTCTDLEFLDVKYSWAFEDVTNTDEIPLIREVMVRIYNFFTGLEEGDPSMGIEPLLVYPEDSLIDKSQYSGFAAKQRALNSIKSSQGLHTLDEIISGVVSSLRFKLLLYGEESKTINPMIKLRNRREFLNSKAREFPSSGAVFNPEMLRSLHWRFRTSFRGRVTEKSQFLHVLGLDNLPSLSVPV